MMGTCVHPGLMSCCERLCIREWRMTPKCHDSCLHFMFSCDTIGRTKMITLKSVYDSSAMFVK